MSRNGQKVPFEPNIYVHVYALIHRIADTQAVKARVNTHRLTRAIASCAQRV